MLSDGNNKKYENILPEAIRIAKNKNLKPYAIYDNGDYLILHLGGKFYEFN
jgi:hypothetical protein